MINELLRRLSELERQMANLIRPATVMAADYAAARLIVADGDWQSGWLPFTTYRAGGNRDWWVPEVGEQVVVICPSGDPEQGIVNGSLFCDDAPAPAASAEIRRMTFADGLVIEHDRARNRTVIDALPNEGTVIIKGLNLVLHCGEKGSITIDHYGYGNRLTHVDGPNYKSESWSIGAIVEGIPAYPINQPAIPEPTEE